MALTDLALLLKEGAIIFEDAEVGRRVSGIIQKRCPFQTEEGLEFCRISTLENEASIAIALEDIYPN
jgi:hypothetical protein